MAVNRNDLQLLQRAQELHATTLLAHPNVVGVGTGYRQRRGKFGTGLAVQVFVQRKYPLGELPDWAIVPREVGGVDGEAVPVDVIEVGFVYAAQDTTRYRPVPGGCSIGHQNRVDASTLGGWAGDLTDDTVVLLSCNHCIANLGVASVPGGIVQPGRLDGGLVPGDLIGALKRFIPITTGVVPLPQSPVDAAIGTITVNRTDNVLGTGPAIYELGTPALGMAVQKRGRTTGFTTNGTITSINVQVTVNYGTATAPINGLIGNAFIVTSTDGNAFANRGDSGSLIFDQAQGALNGTRPVVGMFFAVAGGGVTTWHNDINVIFQQLNLTTICNLIVRALLEALGGRRGAAGTAAAGAAFDLAAKDAQLRALRDRILASTPFGRIVAEFVQSEAAELSRVLLEDDEAFGMAVRTFAPWVRHASNLDVLDATIDSDTVSHFGRLADRIGERAPRLAPSLDLMKSALGGLPGARVRDLLATSPKRPRPKRPAKRPASRKRRRGR